MKRAVTPPEDVAAVIAEGRAREMHQIALYLWLAAITGARRGELCAVQVCDIDLEHGLLHIAFNYVVRDGQKVRKDTKTHQDRWVAIDEASVAFVREHLGGVNLALAAVGLTLASLVQAGHTRKRVSSSSAVVFTVRLAAIASRRPGSIFATVTFRGPNAPRTGSPSAGARGNYSSRNRCGARVTPISSAPGPNCQTLSTNGGQAVRSFWPPFLLCFP